MPSNCISDAVLPKKISAMSTLQFFQKILPPQGVYFLGLMKAGRTGVGHIAYTSLEAMAEAVEKFNKQADITVYYACSSYKEGVVLNGDKKQYRVPGNYAAAKAFWVDLDCGAEKAAASKGYSTQDDALNAINKFCQETGFPAPMVVSSGTGLHCYWVLTESISPDDWKRLSSTLKAVCAKLGLLADPTRTADFASILRPIGSDHKKDEANHKPVKLLQDAPAVDVAVIMAALSNIVSNHDVNMLGAAPAYASDLNDDLTAHLPEPIPSDANIVAEKCAQVAHVRDTGGTAGYDQWFKVIGVLKHCFNGHDAAHQWGSQSAGYSQAETDQKLDTWNAGPSLCEKFIQINPSGCEGCAFKGKIKTPLVLGRPDRQIAPEIIAMNTRYAVIEVNAAIYDKVARKFMRPTDLAVIKANKFVNNGTPEKPRMVTLDRAWMQSPDRETFPFLDLDPTAGAVTASGGLNVFRGFTVKPVAGDITPFMDLFNWLIPEENRNYVLAWLACAMQRLGEKFHAALVIWTRNEGTGKNLLTETAFGLVDSAHCPVVGQSVFTANFNEWMRDALLVIFDEVSAVNNRQDADGLKPMFTARTHRVNGKYEPPYNQPNRLKCVFLSNHPDAAFMDDNDRRYYVVEGNSERPSAVLLSRFLAWRKAGGTAALLHFLQQHDIGNFDPLAPVPSTRAKLEMIEDNRSDVERWLKTILASHDFAAVIGRDICTAEELTFRYVHNSGNKVSSKTITNALRKFGVTRLEKQARLKKGTRVRCYVLSTAEVQRYAAMSESELGAVMDEPFRMN